MQKEDLTNQNTDDQKVTGLFQALKDEIKIETTNTVRIRSASFEAKEEMIHTIEKMMTDHDDVLAHRIEELIQHHIELFNKVQAEEKAARNAAKILMQQEMAAKKAEAKAQKEAEKAAAKAAAKIKMEEEKAAKKAEAQALKEAEKAAAKAAAKIKIEEEKAAKKAEIKAAKDAQKAAEKAAAKQAADEQKAIQKATEKAAKDAQKAAEKAAAKEAAKAQRIADKAAAKQLAKDLAKAAAKALAKETAKAKRAEERAILKAQKMVEKSATPARFFTEESISQVTNKIHPQVQIISEISALDSLTQTNTSFVTFTNDLQSSNDFLIVQNE